MKFLRGLGFALALLAGFVLVIGLYFWAMVSSGGN